MKHKFHQSALCNNSFNQLVKKTANWLSHARWDFDEFSQQEVLTRLVQRFVALSFNSYVKHVSVNLKKDGSIPCFGTYNCGGVKVDLATGKIGVTFKLICRCCAEFLYYWIRYFFSLFRIRFKAARIRQAGTLIYGVPEELLFFEDSDQRFQEFCKTQQVPPLSLERRMIVQSKRKFSSKNIDYAKDPLCEILSATSLGLGGRLRIGQCLALQMFMFFSRLARSPLFALLARDFAGLPVVRELARKKLIEAVIITNSNYSNQPIWMRESLHQFGFKTHEVHYSQNTKPLLFRREPIDSDLPYFRHVKVNEHWVWTKGYKSYLQTLGHKGKISVVDSIMFQPRPKKNEPITDMVIAVFPVTPIRDERAEEIGFINNYYRHENMSSFLLGVVSAVKNVERELGKKIDIYLKHKRGINQFHDSRYLLVCNELEKDGIIKSVTHNDNIYELIGRSKMAISVPYTSTAYIASEMGKPSVFFDPSNEIQPSFEPMEGLIMISSQADLEKIIFRVMT